MPRYLNSQQVADLLCAEEVTKKVADALGISEEKAQSVRKQWLAKIHGRCESCGAEQCKCPPVRKGDNRSAKKVLSQLDERQVLDKVLCGTCEKPSPYRVRNALWRIARSSDEEAFFQCQKCHEAKKKRYRECHALRRKLNKLRDERRLLRNQLRQNLQELHKYEKELKETRGDTGKKPVKKLTQKPAPETEEEKTRTVRKIPAAPRGLTHRPFANLKVAEVN